MEEAMTDDPVVTSVVAETSEGKDIPPDGFVGYVLGLRTAPAARSALRRAGSPATEYRAYGYLAPWWAKEPYLRRSLCAFASLAAAVPGLPQDGSVPVGAMAAALVRVNGMTDTGVERKLLVAQTAGLAQLVSLLRPLLRASERAGLRVDYRDLYWILRLAEHPDRTRRARSRQRLLESYYQALHPLSSSGDEVTEPDPATTSA